MAEEYINRLIACGYSPCNAYITYHDFLKRYAFSHREIEEFITSMEDMEKKSHIRRVAVCG